MPGWPCVWLLRFGLESLVQIISLHNIIPWIPKPPRLQPHNQLDVCISIVLVCCFRDVCVFPCVFLPVGSTPPLAASINSRSVKSTATTPSRSGRRAERRARRRKEAQKVPTGDGWDSGQVLTATYLNLWLIQGYFWSGGLSTLWLLAPFEIIWEEVGQI